MNTAPLPSRTRRRRSWTGRRGAWLALLLLSGCMVGPDFARPQPPAAERLTREPEPAKTGSADIAGGEEQKFVSGQDISYQWWTLFRSPPLSALVDRTLKASPTLAAAEAALRQARELALAQQGALFPKVQVGYSPSYQKSSAALSPPLSTNNLRYGLQTAQVNVGYTLDVFGGTRRQVESLEAQAELQHFQVEATAVTLTTNVVAAAVQEASLRAQISATQEIADIASKSLTLLRQQFQAGAVTRLDVAAQETLLAQAELALPPLKRQLEQNRDLLAALSGGFPADPRGEPFDLSGLSLPTELPLSIPSKLVEQRPDVRAAEAQLHSASALIGVAVANRLPQFTISGAYGGLSTHFDQMFSAGNTFWSIAGSAVGTLFDGGTLLHQQRAAEAAFDQAAALYRGTVLGAFQNAADTIYALQADAETLKASVTAERAAKLALDITLRQQQIGQVNYLSLLAAQQSYQQCILARVQAQASRLSDTAALFQALGGGWWNRPDPQAQVK